MNRNLIALALLGAAACGKKAPTGASIATGDVVIDNAFAFEPITAASGAAYFTVHNHGAAADTILEASSPVTKAASFHGSNMGHLMALEIPAGGSVELKPGGTHLMLTDFSPPPVAGDSLTLSLKFAHAGTVTLKVPVRRYGQ
ncbi:MAG: copper chaperone PCu(A)C [Gemmatimonadales bacterium]